MVTSFSLNAVDPTSSLTATKTLKCWIKLHSKRSPQFLYLDQQVLEWNWKLHKDLFTAFSWPLKWHFAQKKRKCKFSFFARKNSSQHLLRSWHFCHFCKFLCRSLFLPLSPIFLGEINQVAIQSLATVAIKRLFWRVQPKYLWADDVIGIFTTSPIDCRRRKLCTP